MPRTASLNPLGHQLPAHAARLRQRRLGRAHAGWRQQPRLRMEVRARAAHGAVPRRVAVPRHAVGGVRAQRRTAVGADPAQHRRVHADSCSAQGAFQGATPREAYFVKCDRTTTTQADINIGDREHPRRLRATQARRVRRAAASSRSPAISRPERLTNYFARRQHATVSRESAAPHAVSELQVPRQMGRALRRRSVQVFVAQALYRGHRASRRRRSVHLAQGTGPRQVRGHHARARCHSGRGVRALGQQGVELRRRPRPGDLASRFSQGHHARAVQRGRAARARVQDLSLLGVGVPGAAGPRRQRECHRDPVRSRSRTRAGSATWTSSSPPSPASPSRRSKGRA